MSALFLVNSKSSANPESPESKELIKPTPLTHQMASVCLIDPEEAAKLPSPSPLPSPLKSVDSRRATLGSNSEDSEDSGSLSPATIFLPKKPILPEKRPLLPSKAYE